jgi:hypothetical protein
MDPEATVYASQIEFRNVRLSAAETYAKQTIYYLRSDVHNKEHAKSKTCGSCSTSAISRATC